MGNRVARTVGTDVTQFLLDLQPGLAVVLAATEGEDVTRYVYGPMGILSQQTPTFDWQHPLMDGLHSVRSILNDFPEVMETTNYSPYGIPVSPLTTTDFHFTGEMRDANGLQYHRARYYAPNLGVFPSLDPFEGTTQRPMSLNGYSWVEGNVPNGAVGELIFHNRYSYANNNPVNLTDPSGLCSKVVSSGPGQKIENYYDAIECRSLRDELRT